MIFKELLLNISLVIVSAYLYSLIYKYRTLSQTWLYQSLNGILFSGITIIAMSFPLHLLPGVVFDGRSIVICIAGYFGGPIAGLLTILFSGLYRFILGGAGAWTGISVIIMSGVIGIIFHYIYRAKGREIPIGVVYIMGLIVHVSMILLMFTLPPGIRMKVIKSIILPVLIIYPIATALIAVIIREREKNIEQSLIIRESEEKYRLLFENAGVGIGYFTQKGTVISFNSTAAGYMNGKPEDFIGKTLKEMYGETDGSKYMERITNALKEEGANNYEDHVILPSGHKWFITIYNKITDYRDNIIGVQVISHEVTDIKKAHKELEDLKDNLETMVNERTEELKERNKELQEMNKLFIDREKRINELREKVKDLEKKINEE